LNEDVCVALDTRPLAEEALLQFLTRDFYIPQSVWQVLQDTFSWLERREELYESYPRDFVDYAVVNGISYPGNLPYELFTPGQNGKDCDEYRRLYYQANQSSPEEMAPLLERMEALSERHPYGQLLVFLLMIEKGETEQGRAGCRKLAEAYPNDAKLLLDWAAQCMNAENWGEAERYTRRVLELRPDSAQAKQMLAHCLANQQQYEEAKEQIFALMDAAGGDQKRIYELRQILQGWNEALIRTLEDQLQAVPEDMENRIKLAWCYLQNERSGDALRLCQSLDPAYGDPYDYHNLCAKVNGTLENYAAALEHLQALEEILRGMEPDGTEKTANRIQSRAEKLQMQGSCLFSLDRKEEAVQKYEQALSLAPKDPGVLTNMGHMLRSVGDNERAAEVFEKLTNVMPNAYHGFYLLAQALFDLERDRDAFASVNRALELDGGDLGVYLLKMRILLRNGAWDGVRDTLNFLHEHGVTDEITTVWCEAQLVEQGDSDKDKALEMYRALAARVENGERLEETAKLYFRLLVREAEHLDAGKSEDRAKMLALAEKGLAFDENDFACLDYKAWLLKRDGRREEALALYHRLEKVPRRTTDVEVELAELYYQDLHRDADKALHYYQLLINRNVQPEYFFYAGICCKYLDRYEEAEGFFLRMQEAEPDWIDGYNGVSYVYDAMGRYEESLAQINKVIELVSDREGDQSSYYYHKVRILRRLNRPLEAIAVIDELSDKYGNKDIFREKFDILCQFGMWEQAEKLLKAWRKSGKTKKRMDAAILDLELFTGKIDKVRKELKRNVGKLNSGDGERLSLLMGELDNDEAAQMSILEKRAAGREDSTHALMNMAQVQWWNGHYEKAREYARQALTQLDKLIPVKKKTEALYRSRRSLVLAILGRFEEALAELKAVRELPLCETCSYCSCKDADIYEANIEEIRGDWARALELHRRGAEQWPDDMDFISGARRMMRKEL